MNDEPSQGSTGSGSVMLKGTTQAPATASSLVGDSASLRETGRSLGAHVEALNDKLGAHHESALQKDFDEHVAVAARRDPRQLINAFADKFGLSWVSVARMVGVSETAVRKWRRGGEISPENRRAISAVTALLELVDQNPTITDLGSWIEMPLMPGCRASVVDLFDAGRGAARVLAYADNHTSSEQALSDLDPDWRATFSESTQHRVVSFPDGHLGIVPVDPSGS